MQLPISSKAPALLQMIHWIVNPFSYMEGCAQQYGDIFTAPLGRKFAPVVFVSNPQALQQILTSDTKEFEALPESNYLLEPIVGTQSVFMASGLRHRRKRQLLMPPFHGERMKAYGQLIADITEQAINQWTIGKPFSVDPFMRKITLLVILRAVFGLDQGLRYQQLAELLTSMFHWMSSQLNASLLYLPILRQDLGSWSPWGQFLHQRQQIDQLLYQEIAERREQLDSSRTDILSLLMSARDEAGQPMTDEELRDELMTLLFAGHDTTATTLTWACYWIHKLPTVRQKLLEELDSLGGATDPSTLFRLPYLNAVCSETLRISSVTNIIFPRVVQSPVELMGYKLEPGTVLFGCIYLLHQREDLYREPKRFNPERFLERQFSPYEFLPFGGGARRCLGIAFAQFEMKVVLATILSRLELALADNRPAQPVRRGLTSGCSNVRLVVTGQRPQPEPILQTVSSSS